MNKKLKISLLLIIFGLSSVSVFSAEKLVENQKPLILKAESNSVNTEMVIKDNFIKSKYASAENRFLQGNVKASHNDFSDLISRTAHDDYVFLAYAMKMAEYGFFDLTEELFKKLDNNFYTQNYLKDIKTYYYPSSLVNPKDVVYLADAYAAIVYNNLAIETTSELLNSNLVSDNDYKNYLIALGYYKSNNLSQALKYIDNAIIQNDVNVNYKILKTKILADSNKSKLALKLLKEIKNVEFTTIDFQTKIKALEEYVSYKVAKKEVLKDYHLAYYYHLLDKSLLATKVLQSTIIQAKEYAPQVFALLARIYYENNEPLKAQEFAQRAYKDAKNNYLANLTLADISFDERKYEDALKYYKASKKLNKNEIIPSVGIAKSYLALNKDKKSKKMYEKMLKRHDDNQDLLIGSLKVFPQRADEYLPRIISVDITNNDIWLGLANVAINDGNFSIAETCLNNSYYIDENNFKYYYYLSLVLNAKGDTERAKQSLIKCSRLNSDYNIEINSGYGAYEK